MIVGLDGEPAAIALVDDISAGIVRKEDGSKVLVFIDRTSNIQVHVPMSDEQEAAMHEEWTGKHIIIAGADEIPSPSGNGSAHLNGG